MRLRGEIRGAPGDVVSVAGALLSRDPAKLDRAPASAYFGTRKEDLADAYRPISIRG